MKFDLILDDLLSIPKALLNCLRYYLSEEGRNKLEEIKRYIQESKIKRIVFIGHAYILKIFLILLLQIFVDQSRNLLPLIFHLYRNYYQFELYMVSGIPKHLGEK